MNNEKTDLNSIVKFKRSYIAELPLIGFIFLSFVLGIILTLKYPGSIQYVDLFYLFDRLLILPIPLFFIIPLVLIAYLLHSLYDAIYIIGPDYIRSMTGLISFQKKDTRLEIIDLRGVETNRSLYGRLVNTGTLKAGTAMHDEEELFFEKIYNPSLYRDLILKRRNYLQKSFSNHRRD